MPWIAPASEPPSPLHTGLVLFLTAAWIWTLTQHARVPLSVAVIGLGVLSVFRVRADGAFLHPWAGAPRALLRYLRRLDYSFPALLFLGYLVSAAWSEDARFVSTHLKLSAQLVGLPAAFLLLQNIYRRYQRVFWALFVGFAAVSTVAVLLYIFPNEGALLAALGQGKAVPTPIQHVRYATMLALATVVGVSLATRPGSGAVVRWGLVLAAACTLVTVHLIAVRSGLITLYLGLGILSVRLAFTRLRWQVALASVTLLVVVGGTAMSLLPTVQRKLQYTYYDMEVAGSEEEVGMSDAGRWYSLRAGLAIVGRDPLRGAPDGRLGDAMRAGYELEGRPELYLLPTNQFIFSWAAAGLPGLLGTLAVFIAPLLERGWWRRPILLEWLVMLLAVCAIETPLESDVGAGLAMLGIYLAKASPIPPE